MRKLKIIILLALIINNVESYSQDNINYFVKSDSMEVYLNNIIDVNYAKKFDSLFVYIHYDENNRINLNFQIFHPNNDNDTHLASTIRKTHRRLFVNEHSYPIVFDYDTLFSYSSNKTDITVRDSLSKPIIYNFPPALLKKIIVVIDRHNKLYNKIHKKKQEMYNKNDYVHNNDNLCILMFRNLSFPNLIEFFIDSVESWKYYAQKSNRVIFLNGSFYPIVFDYDFKYGTKTPLCEIGPYKRREGTIVSSTPIIERKPDVIYDINKKMIIQ